MENSIEPGSAFIVLAFYIVFLMWVKEQKVLHILYWAIFFLIGNDSFVSLILIIMAIRKLP